MTDYISRADAIEAVIAQRHKAELSDYNFALGLAEDAIRHLPSAETHEIRTETHGVCLISKEDAMGAVQDHFNADGFKGYDDGQKMMDRINALPSADAEPKRVLQGYNKGANTIQTIRHEELTQIANTRKAVESADAEPTVVRCKTMIPYGDFREWAKRIREDNPNVIVIPFDAEVVSAEAVPRLKQTDTLIIADALRYLAKDTERHLADRTRADALREQVLKYGASMCHSAEAEWIPCSERLPSEDGSYLVTSSFMKVYTAHFYSEHGRWQSNRRGLIEAWQPLPKPYREDGE